MIDLIDQKRFVDDALREYSKLPGELEQLYTRRSVPLSIEIKQESLPDKKKEGVAVELHNELHAKTGVSFDATVWEGGWFTCGSPAMKLVKFGEDEYGELLSNSQHKSSEDKYVALIHATSRQALKIDVKDSTAAELKVLFACSDDPLPVQIHISVGDGSKLTLFEWHASQGHKDTFSGMLRDIRLGKNASCEINVLHNEGQNTTVLEHTKSRGDDRSSVKVNYVYAGSGTARARNLFEASGYESKVKVEEIIVGSKKQKFDLNTYVVNAAENSEASLGSAALAMQECACYLKGFAKITNGARGARSFVGEKGLLVDNTARINSIPSMSIGENAVKATHSSATGPIDHDSMFYLTSRGINAETAKQLMIFGFFSEPISSIKSGLAKEVASSIITAKIKAGGELIGIPELKAENTIWESATEPGIAHHYKYREEREANA